MEKFIKICDNMDIEVLNNHLAENWTVKQIATTQASNVVYVVITDENNNKKQML